MKMSDEVFKQRANEENGCSISVDGGMSVELYIWKLVVESFRFENVPPTLHYLEKIREVLTNAAPAQAQEKKND